MYKLAAICAVFMINSMFASAQESSPKVEKQNDNFLETVSKPLECDGDESGVYKADIHERVVSPADGQAAVAV
jgi:hypothetical protein